ncbi:MAG: HAD family phosphatase [Acetobacteraceae bacterium]|nr:HAD family phosphatase [Acetobacteraceae bacterium]
MVKASRRPRPSRPAAVLFDCDGVLADSETLVNRIVAEELTARGWRMTADEARETFLGMALPDMMPVIEARTGPLPPRWARDLSVRVARAVREEVEPIPGAIAAVRAVAEAGIPIACASNSARLELMAKLERLGLAPLFGPHRVLSFEEVPRPKPAGDLYRAAAAACGADPADCVVVEDSLLGVRAGLAAGCGRVLGFAREVEAQILAGLGAEPFFAMAALPGLLGLGSPDGPSDC